jgi:hypothetical protein
MSARPFTIRFAPPKPLSIHDAALDYGLSSRDADRIGSYVLQGSRPSMRSKKRSKAKKKNK